MIVHTRNPSFRVRFITQALGEFEFNDTHASIVEITTSKRMGDTAGEFTLKFVPRQVVPRIVPNPAKIGGWQDLLECMDWVEIWAWVPPRTPDRPLMRGFIDTVREDFDIASGTPDKWIVVTGRDYGKLILNVRLYDVVSDAPVQVQLMKTWKETFAKIFGEDANDPDANPDPEHKAMASGEREEGPTYTPGEIQLVLFEGFYKPQEDLMLNTFVRVLPQLEFVAQVAQDPLENSTRCYSPAWMGRGTIPLTDLWSLMSAYQHKPWRELYVREGVLAPELVYRNAPWLDLSGQFVQPVQDIEIWAVHDTDIIQYDFMRSEVQLVNYFFTFPEMYQFFSALVKEMPRALEGFFAQPLLASNPFIIADGTEKQIPGAQPVAADNLIPLADYQRFGFRVAEISTPYLQWNPNTKEDTLGLVIEEAREQCRLWNLRAVAGLHFNHLMNFGPLVIKGDERIRVGDYVRLIDRGRLGTGGPRAYVEAISQRFKVGDKDDGYFVTALEISRSREHLVKQWNLVG